ncbi:MAG: hypothetical protein ACI4J1_06695 [Ruminiclostridium sp.]
MTDKELYEKLGGDLMGYIDGLEQSDFRKITALSGDNAGDFLNSSGVLESVEQAVGAPLFDAERDLPPININVPEIKMPTQNINLSVTLDGREVAKAVSRAADEMNRQLNARVVR